MFDALGAADKSMELVPGDHYFQQEGNRNEIADLLAGWVKERV